MGRAEGMTRRNRIGNFNGLELGRRFGENYTVVEGVNRNDIIVIIMVNFIDQAPVVQKLDTAIHWITQLVFVIFIHWVEIFQWIAISIV